jgi:uncharacterized protein with von Willebrand factor type A (vWA) domain
MNTILFSKYISKDREKSIFDQLFDIFKELIVYTSGDINEALTWLTEIDKEYKITNDDYGIGDFIEDLKRKGYLRENENGEIGISPKTEQEIRKNALEQIFGKLKKTGKGNHQAPFNGEGDEMSADLKSFEFGDDYQSISYSESIKNAQISRGTESFSLFEHDLVIHEKEHQSQSSTVLMIDISHSMILYGEDRITPAKKVAMALAELITRKYPKDTLDIIVFGNDARQIEIKDLPYLQVGPYHTNTVAGLDLAMEILRKRKTRNKQIFMITDGKPSCIKEHGEYYMNSFGLDRKIVNKTIAYALMCRKLKIPITTFMIAKDPYLQEFVEEFTKANQGKAFYTGLKGLGEFIFEDYARNKRRTI